jgi:hypothetical protein
MYIRESRIAKTPQLMSSRITENPTSLPYSQPFVTSDGTQHVQRTGTTLQPQSEYKLDWLGNDPLHFVCVVRPDDTHLSQANTLMIPITMHDNNELAMPTVYTSGRVVGGDSMVEPHEGGTDTITTRHPDPQPILPARSNLL